MRALAHLALVLWLTAAATAVAQHPLPPRERPLHERIAAADVVAIATIGPIHEGRIEVRGATVLRGDAAPDFEIKRNPGAPPPFVTGVPAVLLLRGARPPYVLVDESREVALPRDAAAAARWTEALRALFAAGDDPVKLLHTYLVWLDGDDETLSEAAAAALSDTGAAYLPLGREDALARVAEATNPRRSPAARRVSAGLAASSAEGATALVDAMPGAAPDPRVVAIALRGTPAVAQPVREAALLRSLAHADADVRRASLMAAATTWSDAVAAKVKGLAETDPDADVKADARDVLGQVGH